MNTKAKNEAFGGLLLATLDLSKKRGGNQKIQKILGERYYYKRGNKWFENWPEMKNFSIARMKSLTKRVKDAL